jgi:uncharacterized protein YbbC (DUF1343 family)
VNRARNVGFHMAGTSRFLSGGFFLATLMLGLFGCGGCTPPAPTAAPKPTANPTGSPKAPASAEPALAPFPVMLGIDVLEAEGFAPLKGKRVGLLTHAAAVNRLGVPTVDVLRRAPGVKLVALYAVEHGIHNEYPAEKRFPDHVDPSTGLMVYSLYNPPVTKATPAQLKPIDVLVVDLQDIGTRSYTFVSAMKQAMAACFENGKEIIVLDRPNPLGGLKVSGPPLDAEYKSYVGAFRVPYVHGLTIGELARMAKDAPEAPGPLTIAEKFRSAGKLTVIPMRGWSRKMRWPETGLSFIPTSNRIEDWAAVQGYPMVGLGTIVGGFSHGLGDQHEFRGISHPRVTVDVLEKELNALKLPGIQFRRVSVPALKNGQPTPGLYIEITDYDDWQPTDLNFWLMKLTCKLEGKNPFAPLAARAAKTKADLDKRREFLVHVGCAAFLEDIAAKGASVDIEAWIRDWNAKAKIYQQQSRKYWLYQ